MTSTQITRTIWMRFAWYVMSLAIDSSALMDDRCDLKVISGGVGGFAQGEAPDALRDIHGIDSVRKLLMELDLEHVKVLMVVVLIVVFEVVS